MTSPGARPGEDTGFGHGMPGPISPGTTEPRSRVPHPASGTGYPPAELAPEQRWRKVFPGHEAELRQLRRWLAWLLPDAPARDDVIVVAVELATNAIRHTASARNGFFAVEVTWHAQPAAVRIAVADGGAPTGPQVRPDPDPLSEHGRGLQVVLGLAARTGAYGDHRGRLVWADVPWTGDNPAESRYPAGHEAAIRDDQAALEAENAGVVTWFGRATLRWWALTGERGTQRLITAPSAQELARKLNSNDALSARRSIEPAITMMPRAADRDLRVLVVSSPLCRTRTAGVWALRAL